MSAPSGPTGERAGSVPATVRPAPAARSAWYGTAAFLLLLAAVFAASYAVGTAAGPVAPGLHSPDAPGQDGTGHGGGGHG
ncbi:hypothetical protein [Streptomyces chumphonensis]|uniref:hypothetical protein n=1 Tax=Streptomyces chumphonensis TaxID=1214925 RepID=UPI003D743ACD